MKKLGILLLVCITALNLSAKGYKFVVDGLEYKTWGSASYSIETYFPNLYGWEEYRLPNMVFVSGARRDISVANIPATVIYNGVTHYVIGICPNAFSGCYNLRVVTIPESVTNIGDFAFDGCVGLASVTFSGKDKATVQGMANYSWDLPSGCVLHCTDGDITI